MISKLWHSNRIPHQWQCPTPNLEQVLQKMWEEMGFKQRYMCCDKFLRPTNVWFVVLMKMILTVLKSRCKDISKNTYFATLWWMVFESWKYLLTHVVTPQHLVNPPFTRWFQVMGIPRRGGHCLTVIYSNIVPLTTNLFTKYLRRHPSNHIRTKKPPEKLSRCLQEP